MITTIHNSANTAATVCITLDGMESLGPYPSYVGSYDNLREVAKAAAVDTLVKSGWENGKVTRVALNAAGTAFQVNVRRVSK